jgi:hypothetical protein
MTGLVVFLSHDAAHAGPIDAGDINSGSTLLSFDEFPNGTFLSNEFPGVVFRSGDTPTTGTIESSPFVATENEFPNATHSSPNKIVGAIGDPPTKCQSCAIVVTFLDPIPTQVAFWVSDPDFGQFAEFSGPGGLLGTLSVTSQDSGTPFFMGFEDASGILSVTVHTVGSFGVGIDDLQFGTPVPEPSTALLLFGGLIGLSIRRRRNAFSRSGRAGASGVTPFPWTLERLGRQGLPVFPFLHS